MDGQCGSHVSALYSIRQRFIYILIFVSVCGGEPAPTCSCTVHSCTVPPDRVTPRVSSDSSQFLQCRGVLTMWLALVVPAPWHSRFYATINLHYHGTANLKLKHVRCGLTQNH